VGAGRRIMRRTVWARLVIGFPVSSLVRVLLPSLYVVAVP